MDWDVLALGGKGVTIQIDKNGDGIIEKTITATAESASDELRLLTGTIVDADPNTLSRKDKNGVITAYMEFPLVILSLRNFKNSQPCRLKTISAKPISSFCLFLLKLSLIFPVFW
ncbi:MAG: hypothetical protein WC878_05975, partial [Candidatus Paceibacterota bacterium]